MALLPHPKLSLCESVQTSSPVQYTAALLVTTLQLAYGAQWSVTSTYFHTGAGTDAQVNPPSRSQMDTNCTTLSRIPTVNSNTVRGFYYARTTVRSQGSSRSDDIQFNF